MRTRPKAAPLAFPVASLAALLGMLLALFLAPAAPASAATWFSKASFSAGVQSLGTGNTGVVVAQFDVTPLASNIDGVIGYADSSTTVSGFSSFAAIVRLNTGGTFDARNGASYAALATVSYAANATYRVKLVADIPAKKYTVFVNGTKIAQDYAFRTDAPATDDFGKIGLNSDLDDQFKVDNHTITRGWLSKTSFSAGVQSLGTANTGTIVAEYDVTPLDSPAAIDGVIGYADSSTTVSGYGSSAAAVRLNTSGVFDVRNGAAYANQATVTYAAGGTYRVKVVANIPARTYSVYVNGTLIAQDYAFRSDAPATDDFGKLSLKSDLDNQYVVANHIIGPSGPAPTPTATPVGAPTATRTPTPTATPASGGNDKFGVRMIYGTKSGGEQWFVDMADPAGDPRFDPQDPISRNSDGSWKMRSTQVRMNVFTSSGYHPERISTYNQTTLAQKGYMQDTTDWRNVEITGYVKVNAHSDTTENFAWYARGGRHTDSAPCEGTAYKGDLRYNGRGRFAKEQWHVSYVFTADKTYTSTALRGRWVGFKTVIYNFVQNGKTVAKIENWLDNNNNNTWVKVDERVDSGGWGSAADDCGGAPDQIITWGGPVATFRWDASNDTDFKHLSVREIAPPQ